MGPVAARYTRKRDSKYKMKMNQKSMVTKFIMYIHIEATTVTLF